MDALTRTLLRRVHHVRQKRQRNTRRSALLLQQLVRRALHVRQTVDVQLEHLRRVLRADPVAGTQVLIDPDLQLIAAGHGFLLHAHLSCRLKVEPAGIGPALTGVEHCDPTSGSFPIMFGGYSPGVRESARVKIGHTPTVFVI